jgi:hypothetical protein
MHIHHINLVQHNFTWKPNAGKNHIILFLFIKECIHWKHQVPIYPATNGRMIQPPIYRMKSEGSSNFLIYQLQPEGG